MCIVLLVAVLVMAAIASAKTGDSFFVGIFVILAMGIGLLLGSLLPGFTKVVLDGKDVGAIKTETVSLNAGQEKLIIPVRGFYYVSADVPTFLLICDSSPSEGNCVHKAVGPGDDYYFNPRASGSATIIPDSATNLTLKY